MPMRSAVPRSVASSALSALTASTIARAAASAWREPAAGPESIPKSAITPSPVNWFVTPPDRVIAVPTASK